MTKDYFNMNTPNTQTNIPPQVIYELKEKVATLQEQLTKQNPLIGGLLRNIHTQLRSDGELVTVLSEEEIGTIVRGLSMETRTQIATTAVKKESAASIIKKALASGKPGATAADLF